MFDGEWVVVQRINDITNVKGWQESAINRGRVVVGKRIRAVFSSHIFKVQPTTGVVWYKFTDIVDVGLDDNPAIILRVVLGHFVHGHINSKCLALVQRGVEFGHIHGFSLLFSPNHGSLVERSLRN